MGLERALKMSLFGEVYPAREARELGLVTEGGAGRGIHADGASLGAATGDRSTPRDPDTKKMMYKQLSMTLDNALEDTAMATLLTNYTDDVKEGIRAFHEKRKPVFQGR